MTCPLVFVDGLDGSGKSTLAKRLRDRLAALGQHPLLLAVDDFRQAVNWAQTTIPAATLYYDHYFNLTALDAVLANILNGARTIDIPTFKENSETIVVRQEVPVAPFIVVEGVFTQRLSVAPRGALVYVDCSWSEAQRRILLRDQARRRSAIEVKARIESRYFPAQKLYHRTFAPLERAHWVLSHEVQGVPRLLRWPHFSSTPSLSATQAEALNQALCSL